MFGGGGGRQSLLSCVKVCDLNIKYQTYAHYNSSLSSDESNEASGHDEH